MALTDEDKKSIERIFTDNTIIMANVTEKYLLTDVFNRTKKMLKDEKKSFEDTTKKFTEEYDNRMTKAIEQKRKMLIDKLIMEKTKQTMNESIAEFNKMFPVKNDNDEVIIKDDK